MEVGQAVSLKGKIGKAAKRHKKGNSKRDVSYPQGDHAGRSDIIYFACLFAAIHSGIWD
jgi:hypothetical protein